MTAQIFMLDSESRSTANNAGWREDRQWARALDHGWNLGEAKQVCPTGMIAPGIVCRATEYEVQPIPQVLIGRSTGYPCLTLRFDGIV